MYDTQMLRYNVFLPNIQSNVSKRSNDLEEPV